MKAASARGGARQTAVWRGIPSSPNLHRTNAERTSKSRLGDHYILCFRGRVLDSGVRFATCRTGRGWPP